MVANGWERDCSKFITTYVDTKLLKNKSLKFSYLLISRYNI